MARKTKEDSQKTRDSILDAAEQVFLTKGVRSATMADIADAAGISRGAVYGHYLNKKQLFIAMCERTFQQNPLPDPHPQSLALESVREFTLNFLRNSFTPGHLRNILEILIYKCEHNDENDDLLQYIHTLQKEGDSNVQELLHHAIKQGELSPKADISLMIFFLQVIHSGLYATMFFTGHYSGYDWGHVEKILHAAIETIKNSEYLRVENT